MYSAEQYGQILWSQILRRKYGVDIAPTPGAIVDIDRIEKAIAADPRPELKVLSLDARSTLNQMDLREDLSVGLSTEQAAILETCVLRLMPTGRVDAMCVGSDGRERLHGHLICINHGLTYVGGVLGECIVLENLEGPLARYRRDGSASFTRATKMYLEKSLTPAFGNAAERDAPESAVTGRLQVELQLMASINQQLKSLDHKLDELIDARMKLLQSVKGVGPRTAEAVVRYIDDPKRFKTGEELASYAGLVPKQMQSGNMNRLGHITHRGPGLLRSLLVESAWSVYRLNPWAQTFVNKISNGSKARRKVAIVALAKKMLIILWGMLKSSQPFRSPVICPTVAGAAPMT